MEMTRKGERVRVRRERSRDRNARQSREIANQGCGRLLTFLHVGKMTTDSKMYRKPPLTLGGWYRSVYQSNANTETVFHCSTVRGIFLAPPHFLLFIRSLSLPY